jgi:hypothetical protein
MPDKTIDIGNCWTGEEAVESVLNKIEEEAERRATVVYADSKLISLIDDKVGIDSHSYVSGYENLEFIPERDIDSDSVKLYFEERYCLYCPNEKMYNVIKEEYYCPACHQESYKDKLFHKKERTKEALPFEFTESEFIHFSFYLTFLSLFFWFVIHISLYLLW